MKKFLALILALVMALSLVACGGGNSTPAPDDNQNTDDNQNADATAYKVAMITDYGDITDQSFNQTTYEACKAFAEANGVDFKYFKPAGDNTADRVAMIESAIDEGYNVIVMPGYAFGAAIAETAPNFSDVKFIALDVSAGDLGEGFEVPANLYSSDTFYDAAQRNMRFARMGVMAVEMEAAALYCTAAYTGKRALAICSISDNLITGEELSADERQTTFTNMMKIALEIAVKMDKS